jgi:succinate-semialdehyde dehydrogenase/glutarate-semialdehyde dehydrogenase
MDTPTLNLAKSRCYVDGQWVGEPTVPVTNKATGEVITRVPDFGEAETRAAIAAAQRAQPTWAKLLARSARACCGAGSTSSRRTRVSWPFC